LTRSQNVSIQDLTLRASRIQDLTLRASRINAAEWYRRAAEAGLPEAAMSLGRYHENGREESDKKQAIEWYHRAAVSFKKANRPEDAEAALVSMENLADRSPAVLGIVAKLRETLVLAKK
ncbi:MAG: hypothetical protein AAB134_07755, partial [Pseudomonadota bacterium]